SGNDRCLVGSDTLRAGTASAYGARSLAPTQEAYMGSDTLRAGTASAYGARSLAPTQEAYMGSDKLQVGTESAYGARSLTPSKISANINHDHLCSYDVGELVVDLLDISQVTKQAAKAHSHAPEGVARRGFDCPKRREMTAYGDGLGARGSLPLPLGLDSLYCGDVAVPTLGPFDTSLE
ncbi:hypothetical protein THAOC_22281, partial [Thalassiosira oceanica]